MQRDLSPNLLAALLVAGLATGCVPLGSKLGKEQVITTRLEPDRHVAEQIVGVPTEHHWMLLFTPEGPEFDHVLSETWRFYWVGADRERQPLHFLKHRGDNVEPWDLMAPISHTNLWVAEIYTGSPKRVERGHYDFRVICFNQKRILSEGRLDYPEYGKFDFDPESHVLSYKMESGSRSYDPLAATGSH